MRLESFAIHKFPPFAPQVCEFGKRGPDPTPGDIHILVGENGTGKTRLLSLFLAAMGNPSELVMREAEHQTHAAIVSTAQKDDELLACTVINGVLKLAKSKQLDFLNTYKSQGFAGATRIANGVGVPNLDRFMGDSVGLAYRAGASLHDEKLKPMAPVERVAKPTFLTLAPQPKHNATLIQSLANMKIRAGMYLAGDPTGKPDRTVRMTSRLENALTRITKRKFVFIVQQEGDDIRLKVNWGGVLMKFQQLPDGLRSIIGWLASCVTRLDSVLPEVENPLDGPVMLFLDEPETHLHPAWQRQILPALLAILPQAQIIVATHSPFVVSSANQGWIYVLKADDSGAVTIQAPRPCSAGDTYIDALEDVLGVKEWYDPETEDLLGRFRQARDKALRDFSDSSKESMQELAKLLATRSDSLRGMMGQELAQFESREKAVMKSRGV